MNNAQKQAIRILTPEEQMAITLSSVHGKSTWEAGEIMGKAHYKYLEIHARGVKYFRMFTEYFTLFPELFPEDLCTNKQFREYIINLMINRKTVKETIGLLNHEDWVTTKQIAHQIENAMKALSRSDKPVQASHLIHLIKDFDRWNNFRILPLSMQEPSAFKRRNKQKIKKLLTLTSSLHPLALQRVIKLYELKKRSKTPLYLPIVSKFEQKMSTIIEVGNSSNDEISKIPLFIFNHKEDANKYLEITSAYLFKENHSCRDGQIFWPELRYTIKKAINYEQVMGVNPTRKAFLDNAGIDPEIRKFLKKREAEQDSYLARNIKARISRAKAKMS